MPLKPPPHNSPTAPRPLPTAVRVCSEVAEADNFSFIISSWRMGLRWGEIELSAAGAVRLTPSCPEGAIIICSFGVHQAGASSPPPSPSSPSSPV